MEMEVVSQEPLALALISAGSGNRLTLEHLAVAAQEVVFSILSQLALLHHLGLLKPPALVLGVGEEFSAARNRQQQAYLAPQIQVLHRPAEVCLTRLLALGSVLPRVVLARREEGGLVVTHNQPNLIKVASHLVAQERRTPSELPLAVATPPAVAAFSELDKVLLASEANSSSSNSHSSKDPQILSEHLALIRLKARLVTHQDLDLAEVNQHKNREEFSGRLLALEGPA